MATPRLDGEERRKAIVDAAVPLFARKGFAGTTTREIAEAAGISEALVFKHFPTKKLLYREILHMGCEGDPALEQLASLQPSTKTLICMVRFMIRRFVLGGEDERAELDLRLRLVLHSCLEDGDYARELFETVGERVVPLFSASIAAAGVAGDLVPESVAAGRADAANRFWFAQHVAAMMAFAALPGRSCVPYRGNLEDIVEEGVNFVLRAIGMTDAAIAGQTAPALRSAAD
jgi:TetR/AcrR family transcriptional regulator, transcriptional repressor of aconitase